MSSIWFVFKVFIVTLGIIFLMKFKVNESTVEDHLLTWTNQSSLPLILSDTAKATIRAGKDLFVWTQNYTSKHFGWPQDSTESKKGRRSLLEIKRNSDTDR